MTISQRRRRLDVVVMLAAVLAITATFGSLASPSPVAASCSQAYVDLSEDVTIFGGNGDTLRVCFGTNIANLATVTVQTGDHYCFPNSGSNHTWNDCISWARFTEQGGFNTTVCLYSEINYINQIWKGSNNGDTGPFWGPPANDAATSVKFGC